MTLRGWASGIGLWKKGPLDSFSLREPYGNELGRPRFWWFTFLFGLLRIGEKWADKLVTWFSLVQHSSLCVPSSPISI